MRSLIILLLLAPVWVNAQENVQKQDTEKFNVEISITRTSAYCGGARPTPEMIAELQTPKPFPAKNLYLKKGERNTFTTKIIRAITSDNSGKVHLLLPPGKYFIVDELKKDTSYYNLLKRQYSSPTDQYSAIDMLCLKKWYEQPDLIFEIKSGDEVINLIVNFHKNCSWKEIPCIEFKGPLPH